MGAIKYFDISAIIKTKIVTNDLYDILRNVPNFIKRFLSDFLNYNFDLSRFKSSWCNHYV